MSITISEFKLNIFTSLNILFCPTRCIKQNLFNFENHGENHLNDEWIIKIY